MRGLERLRHWHRNARYFKLCRLCHSHRHRLHKAEQLGNLIILGSVSVGIHGIEAAMSGCVAFLMIVLIVAGEDA